MEEASDNLDTTEATGATGPLTRAARRRLEATRATETTLRAASSGATIESNDGANGEPDVPVSTQKASGAGLGDDGDGVDNPKSVTSDLNNDTYGSACQVSTTRTPRR
ncbi:hypothetical protein F442_22740 [Phytophthora nicotianae P10297]|uniref:Uncharacterized protein n=1 Tax=Phytophthora nicotianae P10297 TaxID=1317064 RepID=W2Y008_PHYNI|nr:hypothetical protein F442_22740 [Phytophthora nicotianae P10297]